MMIGPQSFLRYSSGTIDTFMLELLPIRFGNIFDPWLSTSLLVFVVGQAHLLACSLSLLGRRGSAFGKLSTGRRCHELSFLVIPAAKSSETTVVEITIQKTDVLQLLFVVRERRAAAKVCGVLRGKCELWSFRDSEDVGGRRDDLLADIPKSRIELLELLEFSLLVGLFDALFEDRASRGGRHDPVVACLG